MYAPVVIPPMTGKIKCSKAFFKRLYVDVSKGWACISEHFHSYTHPYLWLALIGLYYSSVWYPLWNGSSFRARLGLIHYCTHCTGQRVRLNERMNTCRAGTSHGLLKQPWANPTDCLFHAWFVFKDFTWERKHVNKSFLSVVHSWQQHFFTHGHELLRPLRGNYFNYRNQNSLIVNVQCEHFTKEISGFSLYFFPFSLVILITHSKKYSQDFSMLAHLSLQLNHF